MFLPKSLIDSELALVQIMVRHQINQKRLCEPVLKMYIMTYLVTRMR